MTRLFCLLVFCSLGFSQVRFLELDGRTVGYTIQDGFAVTEGDIILGPAADVERVRTTRGVLPRSVYVPGANNSRLWPNATMYYTMEADVPVQANLQAAIDYWNNVGPFHILPRSSEPNYVTFRRVTVDAACNSSVGMVGGQQFVGVTTGCTVGSAIHELGHAWGLLHEQGRADRDAYITVLYDNADKRFWSDFNQSTASLDAGFYDYDSIMHYGVTGFSRNFRDTIATVPPGIPVGQRIGLSPGDIDAVSRLYGAIPTETTIASTPSGLTVTVDGEAITTPKKYNWPPGSQHTVAVPVTQGAAPRYVLARWSDGGAAAHTITASSAVTVFSAQFQRQYTVANGVSSGQGTASITPSPVGGYLADRQVFRVTATPADGSRFVRWAGTTFLGTAGVSVSATEATTQVFGGASSYQATFATGPLHTVDSLPRGVQVTVDGTLYYTPVRFSWAAGSSHAIAVAGLQMQGNNTRRLTLRAWEDGSEGNRNVLARGEDTTFTATFQDQYLLNLGTVGTGTIRTVPSNTDGFYDAGSTVALTAAPGPGLTVRYWVGDVLGSGAEQSVTMDQERSVVANFGSAFPWLAFHAGSFMINPTPGTTAQVVAPGEILSIFGTNIGPATAQSGQVGSDGKLATTVGGVSVTFDAFAAPITFAGPNQINVIVPYGIAGQAATTVTVRSARGNLPQALNVTATVPGLFTYDGSGKGPVAALNQDGSVNSESNPAAPGSVVVLYGAGAGVLEKSFADGQIMPAELVAPKAPVYVRFDKLAGQILYAGAAPALVNGALQVNVVVPSDVVGGGQVPVRVTAGNYSSSPGTTIWIK